MSHNHPESLRIFFATEMWERYGFYTVQTLLALYLVLAFKWNDTTVYPLVGSFTALTYLSPVIGGWIADNFLGQKRSILLGAFVLFFSYIALGYTNSTYHLMASLAGIAVGTGLLKPNISSLLGTQYPVGAPNRERGFTIFYMGITTGIILGTTLPSFFKMFFGWKASFLSAALGLVIASTVFIYGIYRYKIEDFSLYEYSFKNIIYATALIILLGIGCFFILNNPMLADSLFTIIGIISLGYLILTIFKETKEQGRKTLIIALLCLISLMFWAFYFQMFLSLTLLLKRIASPTLFNINFPPPYYVAAQSIGMIFFGIFLGRKHKVGLTPKTQSIQAGNKFLFALVLLTIAYVVIVFICYSNINNTLFSPIYFIPAFLIISLAELLLSPVGLSTITLLAHHKKVSTMTGIFFVSLGIGGYLAGKLAEITAIGFNWPNAMSTGQLKLHYAKTFGIIVYIAVACTIVCFFLNYLIKYLMRDQE